MSSPKVLVVSPSYYGKDYCTEKFVNNVKKLSYPNYDFIMADNSPTSESWYYKKLKKLGVEVYKTARGNNSREALAIAMNFFRMKFIDGKYDYMLVLESDLFPDSDVIQRLIKQSKPVIGSFYLIGHKKDDDKYQEALDAYKDGLITKDELQIQIKGLLPQRACLFKVAKKGDLNGTRVFTREETYNFFNTGIRAVHGCGLGCTLIRAEIVKRFPFWCDKRFKDKHPDVYFYMDLHNNGIVVYVDTSVLIPHQPSRWDEVKDR